MLLTSSPLVDQLARSIDTVCRLRIDTYRPRERTRHKHLQEVVDTARAAIASDDASAQKAALASLDLLSFELCED